MRIFKIIGVLVTLGACMVIIVLWWASRPPKRPAGISASALYIERGVVPFKLSSTPGDWIDCWFDAREGADRCKLTNEKGKVEFEDTFLSYGSKTPIPKSDLILDTRRTGHLWSGTYEKGTRYPIVFLQNGEILLPRSEYEKAKGTVEWAEGTRTP